MFRNYNIQSITSRESIPLVEQPVSPEGSSATEVDKKYAD